MTAFINDSVLFMGNVSHVYDLSEGRPIRGPGSNIVAAENAVHYNT